MTSEISLMSREIRRVTILLAVSAALLSLVLFQDISHTSTGILIGALCGLIGFDMIVRMSGRLEEEKASAIGYACYLRRYLVYGLVFGIAAYRGVPILALLAGMLCHKAAILVYVYRHRKEDGE